MVSKTIKNMLETAVTYVLLSPFPLAVAAVAAATTVYWFYSSDKKYRHIPGPKPHFLWGNSPQLDPFMPYMTFSSWHKEFGPVFKVHTPTGISIIAGDFDAVSEILFEKGVIFSGRIDDTSFANYYRGGGIVNKDGPREDYKVMKNLAFKQYTAERNVLENLLEQNSVELFDKFDEQCDNKFDAFELITRTSVKTALFFLLRDNLPDDHEIVRVACELDSKWFLTFGVFGEGELVNRFPWMRHFTKYGVLLNEVHNLASELANLIDMEVKDGHYKGSYPEILEQHLAPLGKPQGKNVLSNKDLFIGSVEFIGLAATTSTYSFYSYLDVIKRRPDIQDKLWQEIKANLAPNESVKMDDRDKMHYANAIVLEMLRYTSVANLGVPRRTLSDTTLGGYFIPKGSRVITNFWQIHHDVGFWGDPEEFRPERFLDESGHLLPATHPNRTHIVAFGGGPRVCVGANLAPVRLMVWVVTLTQRFEVFPGTDVEQAKPVAVEGAVSRPKEALLILKRRV